MSIKPQRNIIHSKEITSGKVLLRGLEKSIYLNPEIQREVEPQAPYPTRIQTRQR